MDLQNAGFAQPLTGSLYPDPPYLYRGARVILGVYEADTASVARHLPPGVTPLEDPVRCLAWVCHYPFTTFGAYNEAILLVRVELQGEAYNFCPFIYLDADAPMAAGRELWGWPKKLADCEMSFGASNATGFREQLLFTLERPRGKRILTVNMSPERPSSMEEMGGLPMLTLRYIPRGEEGQGPRVCELIRTELPDLTVHRAVGGSEDLWFGRATVTMDSPSTQDPLHELAPTRMLGGFYGTFDWTLPLGRVVKDYLADTATADVPLAGTGARTNGGF